MKKLQLQQEQEKQDYLCKEKKKKNKWIE